MSKRILLIEDMKGVHESPEVILSTQGYHFEFANNGTEGLEKASAVMEKPFSKEELLNQIKQLIG